MRAMGLPVFFVMIAIGAAGCSGDRATTPTGATTAAEKKAADPGCEFSHGVTTCTTTAQHIEAGTHAEVSGCMAFNGTIFVAGARTRTFNDQVQVTETTITKRHGHNGSVFDVSTGTQRDILSSTLVSDVCVPV
jgi:hypothetical protein